MGLAQNGLCPEWVCYIHVEIYESGHTKYIKTVK